MEIMHHWPTLSKLCSGSCSCNKGLESCVNRHARIAQEQPSRNAGLLLAIQIIARRCTTESHDFGPLDSGGKHPGCLVNMGMPPCHVWFPVNIHFTFTGRQISSVLILMCWLSITVPTPTRTQSHHNASSRKIRKYQRLSEEANGTSMDNLNFGYLKTSENYGELGCFGRIQPWRRILHSMTAWLLQRKMLR